MLVLRSEDAQGEISFPPKKIHFVSHICKRENQEDSFLIYKNEKSLICAVADGIGTIKGGAMASELTTMLLRGLIDKQFNVPNFRALNTYIRAGLTDKGFSGAGCTLEGVKITADKMVLFHVGDSRTYQFEDSTLKTVHTDHKAGQYLLNYIGAEDIEVDFKELPLQPLLITTDGFNPYIKANPTNFDFGLLKASVSKMTDNSTAIWLECA